MQIEIVLQGWHVWLNMHTVENPANLTIVLHFYDDGIFSSESIQK